MSNVSPSSLFSGLWLRFSLLTVLLSTVFFHSSSPASPLIDPGPVVQQIEVIGGQPLGSIFQLIQGRSGFIWLATDNGLVRFDGYTVKRFVHDEAAANSISSNFVRDLLQDSQGFIWLITDDNGLNRFSPKTEQFVRFNSIKDDPTTLDSDMLNTISLSSDKQLWIGSSKGINRFDPQTLTNSRLNSQFFADGSSGNNISVLFEDKQQRLWYSVVNKGLHRFDLTTGVHQHFRHDPAKALSLATDWVRVVYERGDGTILVGTAAGLDRFESDTQQFHSINIPIAPSNRKKYLLITTLNEDSFGGLWIGSHFNGVSLLMPGADTAINMNSGLNGKDTFNGVFINDLLQDSSGTLWAATTENGLIRARAVNLLFEHSIVPYGSPLELTTLYADDQDQIWLGTSENLYQFNPSSKRFEMAAQAVGYIKDIVRDSSHSLIVTVADKGVYHFNTQTRQVSRYWQTSGAASDLPAGVISGLAIDQQGTSWIGFSGLNDDEGLNSADISGLFSLSSNSSSNRASQQKPHFTHHLDDFDVDSILPVNTAGGIKIVFGSHEHGLRVLDKSSGEVSNISALNRSEQQDFSHIIAIFADRQQRVWVSIKLLGLAQLDLQTGQLTLVLQGLGAGHSIIRSMVQDADGLMWLGTYGGLIQFNPDNHSYTALEHGQGLRLGKVSEDMAVVMPSGDVMVGHDTGLVRFSPSRLIASEQQSAANFPILLSDFRLFDQPIGLDDTDSPLSATINETTEFTIAYHQSRFSFLFASSDYQSPSTTRYRYRMARAGDNSAHWNDTDANNRLAAFTLLPAGQYVFSVKASNANGSWSDNIRHLNINITPPFWATTIAYVMYVLLAVFAGAMFNYMRVRKLQQRSELLEKRIEQRTVALQQRNDTISRLLQDKDRLFANISHEFRTPLTLILGPLESSLNTDKIDKIHSLMTLAKGNAQRLLSMVDQLLDISRLQEVQEMKTQAKDVLATCQFLLESYRSLADSKNVELLLDAPTGKTFSVDMLPDALEKILSNLLTNAFKYSDGRQVITLTVSKTSTTKGLVGLAGLDKVTIALSDTGMGISDADQLNIFERFTRVEVATDYIPGVGIGLALVKELVEQHQGTISVQSELGIGSTFTVILPLMSDVTALADDSVNQALLLSSAQQIHGDQRPAQASVELSDEATDNGQPRILVIEDNYDMRQYISACLGDKYSCTVAPDGEQGVQMARESLPDLIISDVMMPKMNGFEVTKTLKTDEMTNHIPIILLTAHGDRESRIKGWDEKVDEYLEKPFNTAELLSRIDNLLAIRGLLRQRYQREFATVIEVAEVKPSGAKPNGVKPNGAKPNGAKPNGDAMPVEHAAQTQTSESEPELLSANDRLFFDKLNRVLEQYYCDENFNLAVFSSEMTLSSRQLNRKLKALLDLSPVEAIRSYRLKKAAALLKGGMSPGTVAHEVGFTSHSYFSQCFKAQYQCMPSAYVGG